MGTISVNLGADWLSNNRLFAHLARNLANEVVKVNRETLRRGGIPKLYQSGVTYDFEGTDFADIDTIIKRGTGSCAGLAPWLCAELQHEGKPASIQIVWKILRDGRKLFHVRVRRSLSRIDDPCLILGMPKPWRFEP